MNETNSSLLPLVSASIVAIAFILLWWHNRQERFVAYWTINYVAVLAAIAFGAWYDLGGGVAPGVLSALAISIAAAFLWAGTREYVGRPTPVRKVIAVAGLLFLLTAITSFHLSLYLGRFAGAWPMAVVCFWAGFLVNRKGTNWVERFTGYLLIARGVIVMLRPFYESLWWLSPTNLVISVALALAMMLAALTRIQRHLDSSRQAWSRTLDLIPDPVVITRTDGELLRINAAWENLFGHRREEVIGKKSLDFGFWVDPDARAELIAAMQQGTGTQTFEARHRSKSGKSFVCEGSAGHIEFDAQPAYIYVMRDVSENRRIARELEQLNTELESRVAERTAALEGAMHSLKLAQRELVEAEKLTGLGAIVAGVAHELNTPIGNARVAASTLAEKTREFDQSISEGPLRLSSLRQYLESQIQGAELVDRGLARAAALIESFRNVAADQTSGERRTFLLAELVHDVIETAMPTVRRVSDEIIVLPEIDPAITLESYPGPLGQVLANLINNCVVHAFARSANGQIHIAGRRLDNERVEVVVSDNGCGVAAEAMGRLFDPFYTTTLGRGTNGLGLHFAYNAVTKQLGGQISVTSAPGEGTRVSLLLPVTPPALPAP